MSSSAAPSLTATLMLDCQNQLGEGIQWNEVDQRLYWTDIFGVALWSCDADGGDACKTALPGKLCAFAFLQDQTMLAGFSDALYLMDLESGAREKLCDYQPEHPNTRLNDGNLDRQGRFLIGGINEEDMARTTPVWRWAGDHAGTVIDNIGCANSICFSPSGEKMYFADSAGTAIYVYDYDTRSGTPTNRRVLADIEGFGIPDGSCVDAESGLWNARFRGRCVIRFDPLGTPDFFVKLPVPNVTCCCIGGPNLDRLYITTAQMGMAPDALENTQHAGGLFAVDIPFKGLPHGHFIPEERTSTWRF